MLKKLFKYQYDVAKGKKVLLDMLQIKPKGKVPLGENQDHNLETTTSEATTSHHQAT